jgi:hypothetical protein
MKITLRASPRVLTRVTLQIKIGLRKVKTCWFGTIFAQFAEAGEKAQQSLTPTVVEKSGEARNKG